MDRYKLWLTFDAGIYVYMGGVGFQQLSIFAFSFFAIKFHRMILQQVREGVEGVSTAFPLLYALYAVLILITVNLLAPLQSSDTNVSRR
jgi:hypothetical protein